MLIDGLQDIEICKEHPSIALKINGMLKECGFKKLLWGKRFKADTDYFEKLTISINPSFHSSVGTQSQRFSDYKLKHLNGFQNDYYNTFSGTSKEDIIIKEGEVNIKVGRYYENRNLLIFYYDIFSTDFQLEDKNECLFYLLETIKKVSKENNVKEVDIKEKVFEILIDNFNNNLKSKINGLESEIKSYSDNILNYEREIVSYMRERQIREKQVESLVGFRANGKEKIINEINEVRKLKFVKEVNIGIDGVKVDVGKIFVPYKENNDTPEKLIYISEMYFLITPTSISIDCYDRLESKIDGQGDTIYSLIHPHIRYNSPSDICFGDRKSKIYEYLADFELKKLVHFLYLWAKSYNPNDKYVEIKYWLKGRAENNGTQEAFNYLENGGNAVAV